jgi:phosphomevalonate kinase
MIHVSAPGKLMIAGEWAVLERGNACLVGAVNKRMQAQIERLETAGKDRKVVLSSDDIGIHNKEALFDGERLAFTPELTEDEKKKLSFVKEAIEVSMRYIFEKTGHTESFSLKTAGEGSQITVDGIPKKVGYGSSASSTVATIGAILELNGMHIEKNRDVIYKLAAIAHFRAQGKLGSAFDIAASTYGGIFSYIAPDLPKVTEELQKSSIRKAAEMRWPLLHVQNVEIPQGFAIGVGWTKSSASTPDMILKMNEWKARNPGAYNGRIEMISEIVDRFLQAWRMKDRESIIALLRDNRALLKELTRESGVPIETEDLKKLADIADQLGAAGKLSGAGGGDVGIAINFDDHVIEDIKLAWKQSGIVPLDAALDAHGVRVEKRD